MLADRDDNTKAKRMGVERKDRRLSLKELLGVVTGFAILFAFIRISFLHGTTWVVTLSVAILTAGVFLHIGYLIRGRERVGSAIFLACFLSVLVALLSLFFLM